MKKQSYLSSPGVLLILLFHGIYGITGLLWDSVFLTLLLLVLACILDQFLPDSS